MHIIGIVLEVIAGLIVIAVVGVILIALALSNDQSNGGNPFE